MGEPLGVIICGCGTVVERIYRWPLSQLEEQGRLRVAALIDPAPERLSRIGTLFPKAKRYAALDDALAHESGELLIVASPHPFHAEQALAGLRAGRHVLAEKPMALTDADCATMLADASSAERVLAVGHFRRNYPATQAIAALLKSELLGKPVSFRSYEGGVYNWAANWQGASQPELAGGGVLIDLGPHTLDMLIWWLGDLTLVSYSDDADDGIEVNCHIELKSANGATGSVRFSRDTQTPNRHLVVCERGWVAFDFNVPDRFEWGWGDEPFAMTTMLSRRHGEGPMWSGRGKDALSPELRAYWLAQLENVLAAIEGEADLTAPLEDARKGIALIEACYAAKRTASKARP